MLRHAVCRPPHLLRIAWFSTVTAFLGASACIAPSDAPADSEGARGAVLDVCATAPEGALCDDGNVCTIFDVCKAGVCRGSAAPNGALCTDGNVCTSNDSCRLGVCKGDPAVDTTPCTDGDPCTVGDVCRGGACAPGAGTLVCDDGIACTFDVCVAGAGCVFAPVGDCSMPKDAGLEVRPDAGKLDAAADVVDGKPVVDTAPDVMADVMTSGPDGASERPVASDAAADLGPQPDGADAADAPSDALADAGATEATPPADAGIDADAGDASDARGVADAADAGGPDVHGGGLPVLRASGGACACATGEAPRPRVSLLAFGVVAAALARRRRAPRR
jgi:MYXO-CTERM domain-containing protein